MSFDPFGPAVEPSQFVAFAGNGIDRRSEQRSDDCVATALADPAARILVTTSGQVVLRRAGDRLESRIGLGEARDIGAAPETGVLLGWDARGPLLAVDAALDPEALPAGMSAAPFRATFVQGLLDAPALGELAQAAALLGWHVANGFCARCGSRSEMRGGGVKRVCPGCRAEHFPRTDPVVIMLTLRGDQCLLGRSRRFVAGMFSCLAGFMEPGETIENAVRRETFEESGIRVGRVAYHASQPWPFPHTLMIGCYGEALSEEIDADLEELESCRWFSRAEVRSMLARTHPDGLGTPNVGTVGHFLIRSWAEAD